METHPLSGSQRSDPCPDFDDSGGLEGLISELHCGAMAAMLAQAEMLRAAALVQRRAKPVATRADRKNRA